jgi:hypothetical protein
VEGLPPGRVEKPLNNNCNPPQISVISHGLAKRGHFRFGCQPAPRRLLEAPIFGAVGVRFALLKLSSCDANAIQSVFLLCPLSEVFDSRLRRGPCSIG